MGKTIIFLCCLLLLLGCQAKKSELQSGSVPIEVVRVVSGQTLQVTGLREQPSLISEVRLTGISAPSTRQRPWGEASRGRLTELIEDKSSPVRLEFDVEAKDKYGRTLAYVWKDKTLINELLVKEGHALFEARSPNHKYDLRLEQAQHWSRLMGEGIWNPKDPMRLSPSEFRRVFR
ncbi:thermonuclease family protein [Plectonema cf. radiosum LEGE 06105]|uniref:Thermonuclease family protein n=1 Tax=Plectonema cf. radiosum LEGE 06105 TaxID=945769 RepID=A0A8J7JRL0_9CYAN|nr:thermonuclease family protein [Plectonema radiosum]MBE9211454.1 thermonuclease family protein [Plectonema cf. radiosum LEGE 06105]